MRIGTAGWSIPRASAHHFADPGTHLQRYSRVFNAAEINSSFHRPHARSTYARWADATPADFQFAVKLPREITHDNRLVRPAPALDRFLDETSGLSDKRGPILVQLPPSLDFVPHVATRFFNEVRSRYPGPLVCEPRHITWASDEATALFTHYRVARVAADPPWVPDFAMPGGDSSFVYFRLHGSPRTYWSRYAVGYLQGVAATARSLAAAAVVWCVFDNTASGAAIENARELKDITEGPADADRTRSLTSF